MNEFKFKKGDKVKVISVQDGDPYELGDILTVLEDDDVPYCYGEKDIHYAMIEDQLELV